MTRTKKNLSGQEMGSKGFLTREKIVNATADLLVSRPLRNIKVADIGQSAGISASTFYLYFETVGDSALAAIERVEQSSPKVVKLLKQSWTRATLLQNCKKLVHIYFSIWDEHHALLRVRNFVADEGDRRFYDARRRSLEPIHHALQKKMSELQGDLPEKLRLDPPSTASVILAMLERTAQIIRLPSAHKATRPRITETTAFLVASALSGGKSFVERRPGTPKVHVTD
ncbi:TetR family transcriptional regulator [Sphingorhabdus sp.]|jgi:AcrR family transcriptional regulator|uniref:TetR family transcriptional regulator n=1 Tax=Sphingorhabdus sp. TaxID=1902408 RepID=UPI0040545ED3